MYFGFCVRALVFSLLTFGPHANAFGDRSGGSSGIRPLFENPRNHKLAFASNFESSAQPGGFLSSYGSSHSEGGQVDRYSPKGSVSSYWSRSPIIRKPTQNFQQPPQTNHNANGVIQAKTGIRDLVSPQNGKRFELGVASSKGIIMLAGPQPPSEPEPSVFQPEPQQPGHQLPLTFGQHANALGDRRGGSSGVKTLLDYPRNYKLALASDFESSAQPGGFRGSSVSSHSEGGQVDGYSPKGSVSSYGSRSLIIRKPTQKSQQPPQTNPNANGVVQTKAGMWDLVLPQNEKRFKLGVSSSGGIIMKASSQPPSEPQPSVYLPQKPGYLSTSNPQQHSFQQPNSKPQQGVFQTKAGMWDILSPLGSVSGPNVEPGSPPKPQKQSFQQPNFQKPGYTSKPQQGVLQAKADMWETFKPIGGISGPNVQRVYLPEPRYPSPSGYPPKPQEGNYLPKPQQGVLQTKAGMWDIFSPVGGVSGSNVQPGSPPKPQKLSFQLPNSLPKPSFQQPGSLPQQTNSLTKPQQGVFQTKAGMWDIFSPVGGVSGSNVKPGSPPNPQKPSILPQKPSFQQPVSKPKPQQGVFQTKAGMWDIFSPVGGVSGSNVKPGSPPKPQKPSYQQPGYTPKPQQPNSLPKPQKPSVQRPGSKPQLPNSMPKAQQGVFQTKASMWDIFSPVGSVSGSNVKPGSPPKPQKPSFQQPGPKPQQGVFQTKAGMWDIFSPVGGISGSNVKPGSPPKPQKQSFQQPGSKPQKHSVPPQKPSFQQAGSKPQLPNSLPKPQQGVFQTKAGMWDIFSPVGGVSGSNVKPGSTPKPQKPSSQQPNSKPQQPMSKPQQGVFQTKAGMWDIFSPVGGVSGSNIKPGSPPKPSIPPQKPSFQQPGSTPKHQKPNSLPKPQQGVFQTKAGMWDIFSPVGGVSGSNVKPGFPLKPQKPSFQQPGSTPKPQQPNSLPKPQKPSVQQPDSKPQLPNSLPKPQQGVFQTKAGMWDIFSPVGDVSGSNVKPGSTPKPQQPMPKPQQGVFQTKAGMWDIFSPVGGVSGSNVKPGSPPKPQKPSFQQPNSKPQQPMPKPQQGVFQTKAGMWDIFSPVGGISGSNVKPGSPPKPQKQSFQQPGSMPQLPNSPPKPQKHSVPPQKPSFQQAGSKPQLPNSLPKPQQGVFQTKAGMWDIFSPVGGVSGSNVKPGSPSQPQKPSFQQPGSTPQNPSFQQANSKPQQPNSMPKPQQGVFQTKAGMWDIFSPVGGVSGSNVRPSNLNVQLKVAPRTRQVPMSSPPPSQVATVTGSCVKRH